MSGQNMTLTELVSAIDQDREIAAEVLRKLPSLVTDENTVDFNINPTVSVPSMKMLAREFTQNGSQEIRSRIANNERTTINLIGDITRLAQSLGKGRLNPSWRPLDLTPSNDDGDNTNPLYRAAVDFGLRFPYEGMSEKHPTLKESSQGRVVGSWLLPNFSEQILPRTLGEQAAINQWVSYNNLSKNETTTYRTHYYWHPHHYWYGNYWYWRSYYYWGGYWDSYTTVHTTRNNPQIESLDGSYAWIGQTLYCNKAQVLLGAEICVSQYTQTEAAAAPKYLLVRCKNGRPVLDDVICEGSAEANGLVNASYQSNQKVKITWNHPVHIKANDQVAIVIGFKSTFTIGTTTTQTDSTGSLMACSDHFLWEKYNSGDLAYNLIVAQFSGNEAIIELQPFELSGGISSAKLVQVSQNSDADQENIQFEVYVNNQWQSFTVLDKNIDLPPFVAARLKLRGSSDVMPLIEREKTTITLFRPASTMRYISKMRTRTGGTVKLTYELAGFKPELHTVSMKLLTNNGTNEITPTVSVTEGTDDSVVRTVRAEFALPLGVTEYQIKLDGTTQNASIMFDVTSIIELM